MSVQMKTYPGTQTTFKHVEGDWSYMHEYKSMPNAKLRRRMEFEATNPSALIESFRLLGDQDGSLRLITHIKTQQKAINFFTELGFRCDRYGDISVDDLPNVQKLYSLIKTNNTIPEPYQSQMSKIVEEGKHSIEEEKIPYVEKKPQLSEKEIETTHLASELFESMRPMHEKWEKEMRNTMLNIILKNGSRMMDVCRQSGKFNNQEMEDLELAFRVLGNTENKPPRENPFNIFND